jgi:hypothetical protein
MVVRLPAKLLSGMPGVAITRIKQMKLRLPVRQQITPLLYLNDKLELGTIDRRKHLHTYTLAQLKED